VDITPCKPPPGELPRTIKEKDKKAKDYRQVHAIAKRIFPDEGLLEETARILGDHPRRWSSRIKVSGKAVRDHLSENQQMDITPMLLSRACGLELA
jgi:hypothetical protein